MPIELIIAEENQRVIFELAMFQFFSIATTLEV